jgi:hypothetical protein
MARGSQEDIATASLTEYDEVWEKELKTWQIVEHKASFKQNRW